MSIFEALDAVRQTERLVQAMQLADDVAAEAVDAGSPAVRVLTAALGEGDDVLAIAATHALGRVAAEEADVALTGLLSDRRRFLRPHAAQALGVRSARPAATDQLLGLVVEGGFGGMIAQRTLQRWARGATSPVLRAVQRALGRAPEPRPRSRLVDVLGAVPGAEAAASLHAIARDAAEPDPVRSAAVAALGEQPEAAAPGVLELLTGHSDGTGPLRDVARLALFDLAAGPPERGARAEPQRRRLTVAQLFLHADIDAQLTRAGAGDNGGIATLLVRLGDALLAGRGAESGEIDRVITVSRGSPAEALQSVIDIALTDAGHMFGRVSLPGPPVPAARAWPLWPAASRGIRRLLRAGGVDLLHLRMADVGSLAAAESADDLGVPVVFTAAPDPQASIDARERAGSLSRRDFGGADAREHLWFRAALVRQLARNSAHTVLFPRPRLRQDARDLLGVDLDADPGRCSVVAEGIPLALVDRAVQEVTDAVAGGPADPALRDDPALCELRRLLEQLPPARHGLPLVISVGRLHRTKGMATLVEAWAAGAADRANLLIVGGNLGEPTDDEREQLDLIDALIDPGERRHAGLLLTGHRPNGTVARWLAAARTGLPAVAAPGGVYVCASLKEEFGVALLEAMAAGLFVVAPDTGGPATYVEDGGTGLLVRPGDVTALGAAIRAALRTVAAETTAARAVRSRETVQRSYTIEAMARSLGAVYSQVCGRTGGVAGQAVAAL